MSAGFPSAVSRTAHSGSPRVPVREIFKLAQKFNRSVRAPGPGGAPATSRREDGVDLAIAHHAPRRVSVAARATRQPPSAPRRRAEPSPARNLRQFRSEAVDVGSRVARVAEDHLTRVVALPTPSAHDGVRSLVAGIRVHLAKAHRRGRTASRAPKATTADASGRAAARRVIGIVVRRV